MVHRYGKMPNLNLGEKNGCRGYFPTQNRSKMRAVTSSRTSRPVSSARAERASSTSESTASGDIPIASASAARATQERARPAASA